MRPQPKQNVLPVSLNKLLIVCVLTLLFGRCWIPVKADNSNQRRPFVFDRVSRIQPKEDVESNGVPPPVSGREHCRYRAYFHKNKAENTYQVVFTGKDKIGKNWQLTTTYYPQGTLLFTGDLDRNGVTDLVLLGAFGGCVGVGLDGVVPSSSFTAILFDENGRPLPWGLLGSFSAKDECWQGKAGTPKIGELISLGNDNNAYLFVQQFDPIKKSTVPAQVWKTDLYKANHARWDKLGTYRGNVLPSDDPVKPGQGAGSATSKNYLYSQVKSFYVSKDNHQHLKLSSGATISSDSSMAAFIPFIISESKSALVIAGFGTSEAAKMLKRSALVKSRVKYLACSENGKRPEYIWLLN